MIKELYHKYKHNYMKVFYSMVCMIHFYYHFNVEYIKHIIFLCVTM